jgi:hypothetical protein
MGRELICIAKGRDGLWEAICLDLDISVSGQSFDDVKNVMRDAIASYVEDISAESPEIRKKLMNRSVPFWARLRWTWPFVVAALFSRPPRDASATCEFPVACHA